ncbi:MAG TPA: hypothetical protein VII99_12015 [Bacteroidia bacterium]
MKICITILLAAISALTYGQGNYSYFPAATKPTDAPHFFNVDSVLKLKQFKTADKDYKTIDSKIANYDMEVLGEVHGESFTAELSHTFIRDINLFLNDDDTATLISRAFVYKDTATASKIFKHLNEKVVSAISVPNYRIIYKESNTIYFISIKDYDPDVVKLLSQIIMPVYDALASRKNNLYLLYKFDRQIKKGTK